MKIRLAIIVLALVILPTAALSFLAGRALRSSELILRREISLAASAAIGRVEDGARARVLGALDGVKKAMGGALRGGLTEIEAAAGRLLEQGGIVGRIYVFVSPWGFLYPSEEDETLVAELQRRIAAAESREGPLLFAAAGRSFCFAPLNARPPVYAGFEADPESLAATLREALRLTAGERFALSMRWADGRPMAEGLDRPVVVSDTLGGVSAAGSVSTARGASMDEPLAVVALRAPFQDFALVAHVRDADRMRRADALRRQFFAWGIVLLAAGVCIGGGVLLREAAAEIRKARTRSEFVIGVSHDLRTPLASMKMLAETLYLGRVTDAGKQKDFLGLIVRESERLSHLIERVLFFVRFGQNALRFTLEETDAADLAQRAMQVYMGRYEGAPQEQAPRIEIEARGAPPPVRVDGSAMTQVLLNLLDNADKYSRGKARGSGEGRT